MKHEREYSLDLLKIIATTIIVLHHYQQGTGAVYKYINFWDGKIYLGYLVELFFVLSGLFAWRYIKKIKEGWQFGDYLKNKWLRLVPLLAISVVVETMIYLYGNHLGGEKTLSLWGILLNALGIQSGWATSTTSINGPTWYLSVLLLCYIVFYIITWLSSKLHINYYYIYILVVFIGLTIHSNAVKIPFFNTTTARGYMAFFSGVILMEILEKYKESRSKIEIMAIITVLSLLLLMVFKYGIVSDGFMYILVFFFYPSLIVLMKTEVVKKIFNYRWIGELGKISFNVYIWHEPLTAFRNVIIKQFGLSVDLTKLKYMILFVFAAWIVGVISYYLIEKPIEKYVKNKFEKVV